MERLCQLWPRRRQIRQKEEEVYAYENSTIANNTKYATLVSKGRAVLRERMIVYNCLPLAHPHAFSLKLSTKN